MLFHDISKGILQYMRTFHIRGLSVTTVSVVNSPSGKLKTKIRKKDILFIKGV